MQSNVLAFVLGHCFLFSLFPCRGSDLRLGGEVFSNLKFSWGSVPYYLFGLLTHLGQRVRTRAIHVTDEKMAAQKG